MLRPPQPVLLPWLQPGGLELLLQAPPPCPPPSPCLAKAGAAMPAPTTTAAINAAAAIPLAITPPPQSSCRLQNAWVLVAVPPSRIRGPGDDAVSAMDNAPPDGGDAAFPAAPISPISRPCNDERSSA